MKSILFASAVLMVAAACSSSSTPSSSDASSCGTKPIGGQCKTSSGACAPLECIGSAWTCASGQTKVGVVPGACSVGDAATDAGCGKKPIGSQCKTSSGTCKALECRGSSWGCASGEKEVAVVPGACSVSDAAVDAGCGTMPVGSQCKTSSGACAPLQCVGSSWQCASGESEVAVVPGACSASADAGCGMMPVGTQCKTSAGACAPLQCKGSSWGCGSGETEVAVVPGACSVGDASVDGASKG